jgi:hypothetical protein
MPTGTVLLHQLSVSCLLEKRGMTSDVLSAFRALKFSLVYQHVRFVERAQQYHNQSAICRRTWACPQEVPSSTDFSHEDLLLGSKKINASTHAWITGSKLLARQGHGSQNPNHSDAYFFLCRHELT